MAAGHFSPVLLLTDCPFSTLLLSQEMLMFVQSGDCAIHSVQDQTRSLSGHFLFSLLFLVLRVDTNRGTDLHPYSWGCNAMSCTTARFFSVCPDSSVGRITLFAPVKLQAQGCGGPWFSSALCLPHQCGRSVHVRADNSRRKNGRITSFKK